MNRNRALNASVFNSSIVLGMNTTTGAYVPEWVSEISPPPGLIVMWYSTSTTPPPGWAFCNGENVTINGQTFKTPNLKGRFPFGWGDGKSMGDTGGLEEVKLDNEKYLPAHTHTLSSYSNDNTESCDGDAEISCPTFAEFKDVESSKVGKGEAHNNMPPYRVLKFIIKL